MAKIKSIFGAYADQLQVLVDNSLGLFAPTWYQKYFTWGAPQMGLTFTDAIGRSRINAAASIIARGSLAPLRSRAALEKLSGEIPAIAEKFVLREEDYRNILTLQAMNVGDAVKKQQLIDLLFDDVRRCADGLNKRIDIMCLEAVSTGNISLTIDNNPDGMVLANPVDLLMPTTNRINAATDWSTSATATPITDFETIINSARARGIAFGKILMSEFAWNNLRKTTEAKEFLKTFYGLSNNKVMPTLDNVNEFLNGQRIPPIEIVNEVIGVEKDGVIGNIEPWKKENVAFIPTGRLGRIYNAVPIEAMEPVEHVRYATYNNGLISKWRENEPWAEFTKGEMNAFPGVDSIDSIHILSTNRAFV